MRSTHESHEYRSTSSSHDQLVEWTENALLAGYGNHAGYVADQLAWLDLYFLQWQKGTEHKIFALADWCWHKYIATLTDLMALRGYVELNQTDRLSDVNGFAQVPYRK